MATDEYSPWADLTEPILVHVMSFLCLEDRFKMASSCKNWNCSLSSPVLWRSFNCGFFFPCHGKILQLITKYGHYMSCLTISLNQITEVNRANAISALNHFNGLENIRLTHLRVNFKGENPLFYSGRDFIMALSNVFETLGQSRDNSKLKSLNLSELRVYFDDSFIDCISKHCQNLEYLNILNKMLICTVTPPCIRTLVERCCNLQTLHIYHTSMSDDVLDAFSQPQRVPLKRLGIVCRREEKYGEDLSSEAWSKLHQANPDLKVELGFDNTCPLYRVSQIMKPEIPVNDLHLATFTIIYPEVDTASFYYDESLEKLVIQTRPSKKLDEALLKVAQRCHKLKSLIVYCIVDRGVIDQILDLHPEMKRKGCYILKSEVEPEPWTVGKEEGD